MEKKELANRGTEKEMPAGRVMKKKELD